MANDINIDKYFIFLVQIALIMTRWIKEKPPVKCSKFSLKEGMRISNSKDEYHKLELYKKYLILFLEVMKSLY